MNDPTSQACLGPTGAEAAKAIEKVLEHVRQIHFLLLTVTLLVIYLTWAAYQDAPRVLGDLDRLDGLIKKTAVVRGFIERQGGKGDSERQALTELLTTLNRHQLEIMRQNVRNAVNAKAKPFLMVDTLPSDQLLFPSAIGTMSATSAGDQSIAAIFDQYENLKLSVSVTTGISLDKDPMPISPRAGAELFVLDLRPIGPGRAELHFVWKIQDGERVVRVLAGGSDAITRPNYKVLSHGKIEVATVSSTQIVLLESGFLRKEFPALSGLSSSWRDYSPNRLRELIKSEGERAVSSRSAKLFDIEVGGRDISSVAAVVLLLAMLYFRSFTVEAIRISDLFTPPKPSELILTRSIWVGTHQGLMSTLVGASLVVSAIAATVSVCYFQGQSLLTISMVGIPLCSAAGSALVQLSKLRKALDSGSFRTMAMPS